MSNTDIKWFSFDNTNAPQLSNTWGCLIDVLDACLVNGFGSQLISSLVIVDGVGTATFGSSHNFKQFQVVEFSGASIPEINKEYKILGATPNKIEFIVDLPDQTVTGVISAKLAPLGWVKSFTGTQKGVYRAKDVAVNPYYFRVDNSCDPVYTDSYAKFAKVGILESCNNVDDVSGLQAPFDTSNPSKNWVGTGSGGSAITGWFKWQYSMNENAAGGGGWDVDNQGATNGSRSWIIVGDGSTFYLICKLTVNTLLEMPFGFGSILHNDVCKPFLIGANRNISASSVSQFATPLSNLNRAEVATIYNYAGVKINNTFSRLITGFGTTQSGVATNSIKQDPIDGLILSPIYLVDPDGFIIDKLPLVKSCINNATTVANLSIFTETNQAYIGCRFRVLSGGDLGVLFFSIYEGAT